MDPLSQGTVGAAFAQSSANQNNILKIAIIGFLAGLAPDLDVLIQSSKDPILFLEYHRQFSHSLFFIPFGALIVAILFFPFLKKSMSFKAIYVASFLGYATHGLLDACTSYGTLLFWPFSYERIAWNNISIVDPLFTIPALILVGIAIKTKKRKYSFLSIVWIIFYLSLGLLQYERALSAAYELAESRGHDAKRITLKPSFGNLILWKSIYEHEGSYHVDAIRVMQSSSICLGESIGIFDYKQHLPALDRNSQQALDVERFRWFSQDYLGFDREKNLVTDVRYSMLPNKIEPMWGLIIDDKRETDEHAIWWTGRDLNQSEWKMFTKMLSGRECRIYP